jgi:hypothetical protein
MFSQTNREKNERETLLERERSKKTMDENKTTIVIRDNNTRSARTTREEKKRERSEMNLFCNEGLPKRNEMKENEEEEFVLET